MKLLTPAELTKALPKDTAERFQCVGKKRPGYKFHSAYGEIDLKNLSVKQAEILVQQKCPWIEERKKGNSVSNEKGSDT